MGKKKRVVRKPRTVPAAGAGAADDGDSSPDEMYDEIDQFHRRRDLPHLDDGADAGDSSDNEEVLGVRADAEGSDEQLSEDEPGGFDESSDEDEEEGDENAENYLPSAQAWGKKRKDFYDTSYVDKDYGGFSGSDAEDAELEEEEALTLQKRLAEAISEQDYGLDDIVRVAPTTAEKTAPVAERVDIDIAKLTDDGKLQLFKQQSPELEGLIEEYKEKRDALVHLEPFADVIKSLQPHDDHPFLEQVRAAMEIYANYLLNIQFYLYAKAANGVTSTNQLKNHPVLDRIMDWKKLVEAADDFVERSALTLDCLLNKLKESDDLTEFFPNRPHDPQQSATKTKKRKIFEDDEGGDEAFPDGYAAAANAHTAVDDGDGKRAINKEMEKNKGLTVKRRKDIGHSRIKRRKQYDKALIKRRSQVPSVKRELNKYGGESRGIKTSVVKSVKFKT